ncbi:phosphate propanoyltransferase [Oscillospiraceae bacterium PP1C4]
MQKMVDAVMDAMIRAGLVEVEVSARHVHLSEQDVITLFGEGSSLTPKRPLSQPGQFLCEERVNLIGSKGRKDGVAVLGPVRRDTQVELSKSDCIALGVTAPLRESGDVKGSGSITLEGTKGSVTIEQGVVIARNHVHVPVEIAQMLDLKDQQRVSVEVMTERPVIFKNVVIRVSDKFRYRMHIDFDEANAAEVSGFTLGKIIK